MTAIRVTTCSLLLTLGVVTAPPTAIAQTPARDAAKPAPVGTATLGGRSSATMRMPARCDACASAS